MNTRDQRTLDEILQSTSDVLFPAELGDRQVTLDSSDSDGDTPLHVLVRRKDRYAVDVLIAAGVDVNAVGDMGETPLHVAVAQEDEAIIRSLLRAGARTVIRSEFNQTAAERAKETGGAIARLFREFGHG